MSRKFIKCISIFLTLTFITSQVLANSLAPSSIFDPDYPERGQRVQTDIARLLAPTAIGNGKSLEDFVAGILPNRINLPDDETARKLRKAIDLAINLTIDKRDAIEEVHKERVRHALRNLIHLRDYLSERLYLFNAIVLKPEDYLLGFRLSSKDRFGPKDYNGLSIELIDRLHSISPRRLAQYIFHEAVPEDKMITARVDHRKIYEKIQTVIFGEDEVAALRKDLRNFIEESLGRAPVRASASGQEVISSYPKFGKSLAERYGLNLIDVSYRQITGPALQDPIVIFDDAWVRFIIEVANIQAIAGAGYRGIAKAFPDDKDIVGALKNEMDGNAVTVGLAAIEDLARVFDVKVVVLGNEGETRDKAPAIPVGKVINPDGKSGTILFLNDAVEGTNYAMQGTPGAWAIVALATGGNPFSTDGYRATVTYSAPKSAVGLDPVIRGDNTVRVILDKIAYAKGYTRDTIDEFYKNTIVCLLNRPRHQEMIGQLEALKSRGLEYIIVPDGDFTPRILAGAGIKVKGKDMVVIGVGGANEHIMAHTAVSVIPGGRSHTRYVTTHKLKEKEGTYTLDGADNFTGKEEDEFRDLDTLAEALKRDHGIAISMIGNPSNVVDEASVNGPVVVAGSAITGVREGIDEITSDLKPVTYTEEGNILVSSFVVTEAGLFLVKTTYGTPEPSLSRFRVMAENAFRMSPKLQDVKDIRTALERVTVDLNYALSIPSEEMANIRRHLYEIESQLRDISDRLEATGSFEKTDIDRLDALRGIVVEAHRHLAVNRYPREEYRSVIRYADDLLYRLESALGMSDSYIRLIKGEGLPKLSKLGDEPIRASASGIAEAQNVSELLNNIKDAIQVTKDSVLVTNPTRFRNETVEYLAFESALNKNPDVKEAAQRILREVARQFNLKLASIHEFYIAKQEGRWANITVPAVNGRTAVYYQFQQLFRAAKEKDVRALVLELARSEMRYSAQEPGEFTAVAIAAAIKQGYEGLLFAQGDHYQVNRDKFEADREKELKAIESLIRKAILAGYGNIDLDASTLVNDEILAQITAMEREFVGRYLAQNPNLLQGLDENGIKSVRRRLVDEIEMGKIEFLTPEEREAIEGLYLEMHKTNIEVTMRFIRYIRGLEKEFGLAVPISIGIEERHIDKPEHKDNPSTVLGSRTLTQAILGQSKAEGLVGPSKLSLQTGTMHGVGGEVDFGIYKRHLEFAEAIGTAVFVQHGASTLEKEDFDKMREGDVGEVHLATEYQKIEFAIVAQMMPELGERMAKYLEGLMAKDESFAKKFQAMWNLAFGNSELAIESAKGDEKKIARYRELAETQKQKSRQEQIAEILGDNMPKGLKGTLKDLVKELSAPFKQELWNLPIEVRAAVDQALYEEFSTIIEKLGAANTKGIIEQTLPFNEQPVVLPTRPADLQEAVESTRASASGREEGVSFIENLRKQANDLAMRRLEIAQQLKADHRLIEEGGVSRLPYFERWQLESEPERMQTILRFLYSILNIADKIEEKRPLKSSDISELENAIQGVDIRKLDSALHGVDYVKHPIINALKELLAKASEIRQHDNEPLVRLKSVIAGILNRIAIEEADEAVKKLETKVELLKGHVISAKGGVTEVAETQAQFEQHYEQAKKELEGAKAVAQAAREASARASASGREVISSELPVRAEVFKANLIRILSEHRDRTFVLAIDSDIGEAQKARIMPIYKAVDQIKDLKDSNGKELFPNLRVIRASGTARDKDLVSEILKLKEEEKGGVELSNVFVVARQANVDANIFDAIKGEAGAWITAIDDSTASQFTYIPVFEAATLSMMAYLKADLSAIKNFYDSIADKPIAPDALADMLNKRIIYILPKITPFNPSELRELYELAKQVYIAA